MSGREANKRWRVGLPVFVAGAAAALLFFIGMGYVPRGSDPIYVEALCAEQECFCEEWSTRSQGPYLLENNVWGKGELEGYAQCAYLEHAEMGVDAGWAWDWPGLRVDVVAYPSLIYGKKPWFAASTTPSLPRPIGDLECLWVDFEAGREGKGNGNLAFDLWVTEAEGAGPESITAEVMIWLWHEGMRPAGGPVASLALNGRAAELWLEERHEDPNALVWSLLTFVYGSEVSQGRLDLKAHLDFLVEKGYLSPDAYLADVELGNEVVSGYGQTTLRGYEVGVCSE